MNKILDFLYKKQSLIYKIFLFLLSVFLIVYFFPTQGKFKYEIVKNKPWQYENLYAPFDFPILKSDEELEVEKIEVQSSHIPYYNYNQATASKILQNWESKLNPEIDSLIPNKIGHHLIQHLLDSIYSRGLISETKQLNNKDLIYLKRGNKVQEITYKDLINQAALDRFLNSALDTLNQTTQTSIKSFFYDLLEPNVTYDRDFNEKLINSEIANISPTRGSVSKGSKIIAKGELIEGEKLRILESLKSEYQSEDLDSSSYVMILSGYALLVALALLMLLLFLYQYRQDIYENNNKLTFIFFNILFMVFLTLVVMKIGYKYVYIVPLCILPLTLKAFFDARLGLFSHVITVLILGFVVPNSFEYMFLQISAGIVTILTVSELYKRANLFISVAQITGVYMFSYLAFSMIQEADFQSIDYNNFIYFILSGVGLLFVQPLIYTYEKIFGLVSDLSLLELTDTNSKILKELANVAPGTFHHSLNVANLAEAAANEIGANALLVRVGALYHDIGKMKNPIYFTENQSTNITPHDELSPQESAQIIIGHRLEGIEFAKKNNLPDRIIDFIRTHHGTTTVYYFYQKAQEDAPEGVTINPEDFTYPGPKPYSKETAILMMCDSVEAASKSLKSPNTNLIDEFVEKIINKQIDDNQFENANITFKDIQLIKKILKAKLNNIYHLRIEYPD
ncbi:HD family phosphohydrolase [Psychroflexus sp. ALD_RP9]|uniref:HD family phosphohydrolase n=1 Tax=Psychroflexus sp. ALD_RP9 TaxID=2777186 RepID=UPI001A8ECEE3|nr:HDIG domain-containing metalloprotein [Psychroflexus sp. ALD_RP9]QSS97112.1 HDIG domain-containing protein [Psychroflexus sp. ALD_RP9]